MKRLIILGMTFLIVMGIFPAKPIVANDCSMNIVVMNNADSGPGSLRQAIADVCDGGTITFDASLSGATILLSSSLTLAINMTVDGSMLPSKLTISGGGVVRVIWVNNGITVTLESLIIANGTAAIDNTSGGGINNAGGTLLVTNSVLFNNSAEWVGGGIFNSGGTVTVINSVIEANSAEIGGGGIMNNLTGTLTVRNSTIVDNSSTTGGGLYNEGHLTLSSSTLVGNQASPCIYCHGGGIFNNPYGTLIVTNSTFTDNFAQGWGNGIYNSGALTLLNSTLADNQGTTTLANVDSTGVLNYANTIIADTYDGQDCFHGNGGVINTNINNLVEDGTCPSDYHVDPKLGPLADNGGPTHTMALLAGSPAIDAGDDSICSGTLVGGVDQRGAPRTVGAHCDIGAFEWGAVPPCSDKIKVINTNDSGAGSLRQAVEYVCLGGEITFDASLSGATITLSSGHIWINKSLTMTGLGADLLTISGGEVGHYSYENEGDDVGGVFWLKGVYAPNVQPITVNISGLTIRDGRAQMGGGIYNGFNSTLVMSDCVIGPNNIVEVAGGGISNNGGSVNLVRCTVVGNHGTGTIGGAGIFIDYGVITLVNSTVTENVTNNLGGGILVFYGSTATLVHSTVSGNIANDDFEEYPWGGGGGIYVQSTTSPPNGMTMAGGELLIHNSIVAGNIDKTDDPTEHNPWPDVFGEVTSLGGNLIGDGTGSLGWTVDDLVGDASTFVDPLLADLALNPPGSTPTFALLEGSPAINQVACAEGVVEDQRGVHRPQGVLCDIGAYEFDSIVEDTTPPVIAPHDDVTAEATSAAGAIVTYTSPATSDAVDGPGVANCSPVSGSQFSLGDTIVTCTAQDTAGNQATPTTFTVHVVDTTPPEVTVPSNMTVMAMGESGATVVFNATAYDLVDGALTPTCNPASGSLFPVGTTTVICTAKDAAQNQGQASFTVTVEQTLRFYYIPLFIAGSTQ